MAAARPKALLFDVFGTVVHWRAPTAKALEEHAQYMTALDARKPTTKPSWNDLAERWYKYDVQGREDVDPSKQAWVNIDDFYIPALRTLLAEYNLSLPDDKLRSATAIWHNLPAWPDSAAAIRALNALEPAVLTGTLSDGNTSLLRDLDSCNNLGFQRIIGADVWQRYKPNPAAYLGAVEKYGYKPEECVLVAAHLLDLQGAHDAGLRCVYLDRGEDAAMSEEDVHLYRKEKWIEAWVDEKDGKDGAGLNGTMWGIVEWMQSFKN